MTEMDSICQRLGTHLTALLHQLELSPDKEAIQACASISKRFAEVLNALDPSLSMSVDQQRLEHELRRLHREAHSLVRLVIDNRSILTDTSQEQEATVRRLQQQLTSASASPCSRQSGSSSLSTRFSPNDDDRAATRRLLLRDGVFETLTLAMRQGTEDQKTDAALVLSHAPTNDPVLAQLAVAHRSIDALSGLLVSGTSSQRHYSALALRSLLGLDHEQLDALRETWPRIQQIKHGTEDDQVEAAALICRWVSKGAPYQTLVALLGAIPPLSRLLCSGSPHQMQAAAAVLGALAVNHHANQEAIIATGVCSVLQALLKRASPSTRGWAKAALRQIHPDACLCLDQIRHAPQVTPMRDLVKLLATGSDQQKSHAATELIKKLAKNPSTQDDVARAGAIPPLMELLRHGTSSHKQYAMVALVKLGARNEANRRCIVQEGALLRLEDLVFCGTEREQELAAEALSLLRPTKSHKSPKSPRGGLVMS